MAGILERIRGVVQAGWEAAQTNRVNRDVHKGALGGRVNDLLDAERAALFSRGEYQARNSTLLEGVIKTYESFMVGKAGPIPRVLSGDAAFNTGMEEVWRRWWEVCDFDGISSGGDKLALWLIQNWKYGEFFEQFVNDGEGEPGLPQLRVRSVHPERVKHDVAMGLLGFGSDGVILDGVGRRTGYRVVEEVPGKYLTRHFTVPAVEMLHFFEQVEPGQLRGIPWIASALPVLADIRALDESVLASMRTAADMAAVLQTRGGSGDWAPEPVSLDADAEFEIKRNQLTKIPEGWEVSQMVPAQPGLNHTEYRHDRLRELGRGRGLSLLHVLADGSNHNYSSMRGDNQMLDMVLGCDRGKLERKVLSRLFKAVMKEAVLMGLVDPVPKDFRLQWVWPAREYIDPMKEAQGQIMALEGGTKSLHEVCAERGVDYDDHVQTLADEVADLKGRGLVHPMVKEKVAAGGPEDSRNGAEPQRKTQREEEEV